MSNKSRKCKLYHGTGAGKDDFVLENFIITGAVSGKTLEGIAEQQGTGLFTSLDSRWPLIRAICSKDGREMVVELETSIDGINWEVDYRLNKDAAFVMLMNMKDLLLALPLPSETYKSGVNSKYKFLYREIRLLSISGTEDGFKISYQEFKDGLGVEIKSFKFPCHDEHAFDDVFFLHKLHAMMRNAHPERYEQENFRVLNEIIERGEGSIKYIGKAALPVNRVFTCPPLTPEMLKRKSKGESIYPPPLDKWEVVYDRHAGLNKTNIKPPPAPPGFKL